MHWATRQLFAGFCQVSPASVKVLPGYACWCRRLGPPHHFTLVPKLLNQQAEPGRVLAEADKTWHKVWGGGVGEARGGKQHTMCNCSSVAILLGLWTCSQHSHVSEMQDSFLTDLKLCCSAWALQLKFAQPVDEHKTNCCVCPVHLTNVQWHIIH